MMKKLFIFSILVLFFTVTVSAALAAVQLTYWTHEDPNRTEIETKYIKEFEAANPGVTVERVTSPSGKMAEKVLTAFAANRGPDMFNMEIEQEYAYIVNRRLAPIDFKAVGYSSEKAIYDDYLPKVLDPATFEGKLYGLPLELTNWCIYVNDRIFKSAGLDPAKDYPKTWEDMVAVSEKIVIRDGQIIKRRGFDFRYPYYLVSMVPMVEQLGGQLISDDGKKAIINDQAWIKFLTFMKEWGPNGKNLGSPTYTPARNLFNKDKNEVAMCESGLYQQGRIRQDNPEFYNSKEWRVIPYPVFRNAVKNVAGNYYGHYLVVNASKPKENQQMTWKLIRLYALPCRRISLKSGAHTTYVEAHEIRHIQGHALRECVQGGYGKRSHCVLRREQRKDPGSDTRGCRVRYAGWSVAGSGAGKAEKKSSRSTRGTMMISD